MTAASEGVASGDLRRRPVARHRLTGTGLTMLVLTGSTLPLVLGGSGGMGSAAAILVVLSLAVTVIVGVAWPTIAVRRCRVEARTGPDGTVGQATPLTVTTTGDVADLEARVLDPEGPWFRPVDGVAVDVDHVAERRGLFDHVRVEVRTAAPLGLFSARRVHLVAMPSPIAVAPVPLAVDWRPGPAPLDGRVQAAARTVPSGDLVRSVRPYATGDPARLVHWPSTARTGALVVRELEPPSPLGQVVVLDLTGLGDRAEEAAAYALGACLAVLDAGGTLVLCTHEASGPVAAETPSRLAARRRIAAALPGRPGAAPEGWPLVEIGR